MGELKQQHYIGDNWRQSAGEQFESLNPANGESLWRGNAAQQAEIDAATSAAQTAFKPWSGLSFEQRSAFVARFAELVKQREQQLAEAIHLETGKPLWESKTEVGTMVAKAAVSVKAYEQRSGSSSSENGGVRLALVHRPIGVFAVLGPYNFPGHLPNGHIIPALLAGNTVVFKPSELTPLVAELMLQCWIDSGLPAGVINLVQGGGDTGAMLANAPLIDGLLFTGSSRTGQALHKMFAGKTEKMLALEMGGNNPLLVEQVTDLEAAVYCIIQSAFISAGQRCTCARRLIVLRSNSNEELIEKLKLATAQIKVGSDDDCFIGPLIANPAADTVMAFEQSLLAKGSISVQALVRPDAQLPFIHPGIVDVTAIEGVADEECFGPLLQLIWVDDMEQAIDTANATRFGLSAGLLSDNAQAWQQFYRNIRAGIVNWNRPITGASGAAPFGGIGASGNFRPGAYYAADYAAYPVASMMSDSLELPAQLTPGVCL